MGLMDMGPGDLHDSVRDHATADIQARQMERYGLVIEALASVFGSRASRRAVPGPDFPPMAMDVPVSMILDGYLFAAGGVPPDERDPGSPTHVLLVACTQRVHGVVGLWSRVDRPADLMPGLHGADWWANETPAAWLSGVVLPTILEEEPYGQEAPEE